MKKAVVFAQSSPTIQIVVADSSTSSAHTVGRHEKKRGRKRSATKTEDEILTKKLLCGEEVTRNKRQEEYLNEMKAGIYDHIYI